MSKLIVTDVNVPLLEEVAARTDAQIVAQQKIDQVQKDKDLAEQYRRDLFDRFDALFPRSPQRAPWTPGQGRGGRSGGARAGIGQ